MVCVVYIDNDAGDFCPNYVLSFSEMMRARTGKEKYVSLFLLPIEVTALVS